MQRGMTIVRGTMRAILLLLLAAPAHSSAPVAVFVTSRHSLKSINYTNEFANVFDARLTMTPGKTGEVTPHGLKYAKLVGAKYWEQYGHTFFSSQKDCDALSSGISVYADTDVRDQQSTTQFLKGFAPACGQLAGVSNDDTHKLSNEGKESMLYDGCGYATEAEVSGLIGGDVDAWLRSNVGPAMKKMGELVACCHPSACGGSSPCSLHDVPNVWKGGFWTTWKGGFSIAAHLAVTLQAQYVNNMDVYGNLSATQVTQYYEVAEKFFSTYKNRINKNRFGGNLATALLAMILHAAGDPRARDPIVKLPSTPPKLTWFMSHDVNFAFMADFLELTTNTPSYTQGTSSIFLGGLIIELHGTQGNFTVQAYQQGSSITQIRELSTDPMMRSQISIPGCSAPLDCPLNEFVRYLARRIRRQCIDPTLRDFVASLRTPPPSASSSSGRTPTVVILCAVGLVALLGTVCVGFRVLQGKLNSSNSSNASSVGSDSESDLKIPLEHDQDVVIVKDLHTSHRQGYTVNAP